MGEVRSSLITFLGKGLRTLLNALGDGRTDLDLYRTRPKVTRLHESHNLFQGWSCKADTLFSVDKFVLRKGRITLRIDAVNCCNSDGLPSWDIILGQPGGPTSTSPSTNEGKAHAVHRVASCFCPWSSDPRLK